MNKKTIVVNLMFYTFGVSQSWQCQSFSFKHYSHFSKRARDAIAGKTRPSALGMSDPIWGPLIHIFVDERRSAKDKVFRPSKL